MMPGTSHRFSAEYPVREDDLYKKITNEAVANGTNPCDEIVQNSSTVTVTVVPNVDEAIESALAYILSCQNPDGGFGHMPGGSSSNIFTAEAAMALAQTGNLGRAVNGGKTPLDYLTAHPPGEGSNYAAYLGRYVMGVLAAGGNPYDVGGVNYVQKLKDEAKNGLQSNYFADAFVVMGLAATGQGRSQEARDYVSWVKAAQSGGAWFGVDATGLMANALIAIGEPVESSTIQNAVGFFRRVQNSDGGFPADAGAVSNTDSEEYVIMALNAMGESMSDWSIDGYTPITHLLTCQKPSGLIWWQPSDAGSGSYFMAQTAYGVICLEGGSLPAFTMSQMPEMNPEIEVFKTADVKTASVGDTVQYSIWINNSGNTYLKDAIAFDNLTGKTEPIGLMAPGQNYSFAVSYQIGPDDLGKVIVNEVTANATDSFGALHENSSIELVAVNLSTLTGLIWEDLDEDGIQDPNEPGLAGVPARIKSANPGKVLETTRSDDQGIYGFYGLNSGEYIMEFSAPIGYAITLKDHGGDDEMDSDADQSNGCTDVIHLGEAVTETSWDVGLCPAAALNVTKTADKTAYKRGDEITYNISICNRGLEPATNVIVRDQFNSRVEIISASPEPGSDGLWRFSEILPGKCRNIILVVKVPKPLLEARSDLEVRGVGFVNVAGDYSTTLEPFTLNNLVSVTSDQTAEVSDLESVTILGDPGTELTTREHGSGTYRNDEEFSLKTENKSISRHKDLSAEYSDTSLRLYGNRSVAYTSRWNDLAQARNRVTGASVEESYRYSTSLDKESSIEMDKNGSTMEFDSEFQGAGHIGMIKKSETSRSRSFESSEDYEGSFKVLGRLDEYGTSVESDKSAAGSGFVSAEKRIGNSQGTREYGSGSYESEEQIRTSTNYIYKNLNVTSRPSSFKVSASSPGTARSSSGWNEAIWSRYEGDNSTGMISEEYTDTDRLKKETLAEGLNQMATEAHFSGSARFRVNLFKTSADSSTNNTSTKRAPLDPSIDLDEQYLGDYSIRRSIVIEGVSKFDQPHLTVSKSGELVYLPDSTLAKYEILIKNDGNASLAPIRIKDTFPLGARFINASSRPTGDTDQSAEWVMTHLAIGNELKLYLWLDVTSSIINDGELVNLVEVYGGYNDEWVSARNFDSRQIDWLSCSLNRTLSVTKEGKLDQNEPNIIAYTLTIKNLEERSKILLIVDDLQAGMSLLNASTRPSTYQGSTVTWDQVSLGPKETLRLAYRTQVSGDGTYVNRAQVYAKSSEGASAVPVYASATVNVGTFDEWNPRGGWKPPDWGFEYAGGEYYNQTCEDICELKP